MSTVIESNKIDSIGINKRTNKVMLRIIDTLDWIDEEEHLYILQEK